MKIRLRRSRFMLCATVLAALSLAVNAGATVNGSVPSVAVGRAAGPGLRLHFGPNGFAPVGRRGTGARIPLRAQDPITLQMPAGKVTLTPLGVSAGAEVGQIGEGGRSVLYPSTARSTTTRVLAQPGGAEVLETLGSSGAPNSFSWRVLIDGVEKLVPTSDGGVNIVETAGPTIVGPTPAVTSGSGVSSSPAGDIQAAQSAPPSGAELSSGTGTLPPAPNSLPLDAGGTPEGRIGAPCDLASTVPAADRPAQSGEAAAAASLPPGLEAGVPALLSELLGPSCTPVYELASSSSQSAEVSPSVSPAITGAQSRPAAAPRPRVIAQPRPTDQIAHAVLLATIRPPRSLDAHGVPVPTSLSVSGDVVTMRIDTRAGHYVAPIVADPIIGEGEKETYGPPNWSIVQRGTDQFGRPVLTLEGHEWWAVGFNDYRLMNYAYKLPHPFVNTTGQSEGCGSILNSEDQRYQLERIKASGANTIRVWFFQKYYQDYESDPSYKGSNGGHEDPWLPYIHLLELAKEDGLRVIPVLVNEWHQCDVEPNVGSPSPANDGGHKSYMFYKSEYDTYNPGYKPSEERCKPEAHGYSLCAAFGYRYTAETWAEMVAKEFGPNSTDSNVPSELYKTIAYYQLVNEAETDESESAEQTGICGPGGAELLKSFGGTMARAIKAQYQNNTKEVPEPLVSLGTMAIGQCGVSSNVPNPIEHADADDYSVANSEVDICEIHDYDAESVSDPEYEWYGLPYNSLSQRLSDCGEKPMVVGEAGIEANVQAGNVKRIDCGISSKTPGYDEKTGCLYPYGTSGETTQPQVTFSTLKQRAQYLDDKIANDFDAGASGYILWDMVEASSDSTWNQLNDQTLGYGAYGIYTETEKHQDPALCVVKDFGVGNTWTLGYAPPEVVSEPSYCDGVVGNPGPVDHYKFEDGTAEGWSGHNPALNPSPWGDLEVTYSSAYSHTSGEGSLKLTVGGNKEIDCEKNAKGECTVQQIEIGGHTYNPYSDAEVASDAVGLLSPGDKVVMYVYDPVGEICSTGTENAKHEKELGVEVKPVLRVNEKWSAILTEDVVPTPNAWTKIEIKIEKEAVDSQHEKIKLETVHSVGLEVDVPGENRNCYGQNIYLADVTWPES
jgi:hypothetical protein